MVKKEKKNVRVYNILFLFLRIFNNRKLSIKWNIMSTVHSCKSIIENLCRLSACDIFYKSFFERKFFLRYFGDLLFFLFSFFLFLRFLLFRYFGRSGFRKQLRTSSKWFSALCTAYIVWWSSGPALRDDIGQNGIFLSFFNAAPFPFVGQFLAHLNRLQALVDPFAGISFTVVVFEHTFDTRFRIVDLLQVFTSQLS